MRSDLAAVVTTLGRLKLDVEQLRGDIVVTRPGAPEAVKILDDHLKLALSTVTVLWDRLDDVLETGRFELEQILDEKAAKEIGELVRTFTAYEAGRLAIRALHRASRALEHKLDQIDDKTWFIITLAQLAFHSDISRNIADAVRDAAGRPGDTAGPFGARELLTALAVASCERVLDDANTHALDVARADTLLAPLYSALICSYLEYENAHKDTPKASLDTEMAAVRDATKTCIGKQPSDLQKATVSVRKDVLEKAGKADRELSSTVSRVQSSYSTQVLAPVVSKTETSRTPLLRQERKDLLDGMRIMQKQVIPPG